MGTFSPDERLRRLESRVDQIEARLGIAFQAVPAETAPPAVSPPPAPAPASIPREEWITIGPAAPEPVVDRPRPPVIPPLELEMPPPLKTVPPAQPPPVAAPRIPKELRWRALEETIGLKWTGWVGAVVLVFGAVLGVQFAYEHNWFGHIPPALRLAAIFLAGFSLIAAGEFVIRRVHQVPAASLFGAGVATLFVGAYAGYAYFEVYSRSTSMSLMAASTLAGAAVAMRGNLVSIAVLSLIGANVAPLLVATPNAPIVPFLFYLFSMEVVALFLAEWGRGGKWWTLRGLSLVPAVFWMAEMLASRHGNELPVLAFMVIYAILYQAELILAAMRSDAQGAARHAPSMFAICVTAALTLGVLIFHADASKTLRSEWVIGLATFSALLGFGLTGRRDALRRLAVAHRIAAAGLLILAVPVATSGVRVEVGWAVLAVGFAAAGRFAGSRISRAAAPAAWLLGIAHLIWSMLNSDAPMGPAWITFLDTSIGSTAVLAWILAVAGHVIAALTARPGNNGSQRNSRIISVIASLLWVGAAIAGIPPLGATAWIVFYAWLLLAADAAGAQPELAMSGVGVLLIATVKWAVLDTLAARLSPQWAHTRPVFNSLMGDGLLACVSLLGFYRLNRNAVWRTLGRRGEERRPLWALGLAAAVIALVTIGLSFEVDRTIVRSQADVWQSAMSPTAAEQLSWTILWSAGVAALLTVARSVGSREERGRWINRLWLLAGLLAGKFFIVDTLTQLGGGPAKIWPVLNLQVLAGASVLAVLAFARLLMPAENSQEPESRDVRWRIGMLATLLLAWMGTLEIDRFVTQLSLPAGSPGLDWHLKNLGWTLWWCIVTGGSLLVWRRVDRNSDGEQPWQRALPALLGLIAAKYLFVDAIAWRFMHQPVAGWWVLLNLDALTAAVALGAILLPRWAAVNSNASQRGFESAMCLAILLAVGTLEVDRAFCLPSVRASLTDAGLAEQVGLSIFWSVFAVLTLAAGFWKRAAKLRYAGLGLLAVALLKVVLVDLSQIGYGYRVLSFIGLGLLLLFTSVMYGKISPLLLSRPMTDNAGRGS